ncbi:MAG TPA: pilus assembly PilX N-terminal domain-containing protein, partial [Verrucomicrobiae bacterium]
MKVSFPISTFRTSLGGTSSRRPSPPGLRPSFVAPHSGVALVVTLILLSIITFMAIAFLVLSHREQSSVVTTTDQTVALQGANSALE